MSIGRTIRGINTVARRRGLTYFGYLATDVALPKAAYAAVWGPSAPRPLRTAFAAGARLATTSIDPARLAALGITVTNADRGELLDRAADPCDVEALMNRAHRAGVTGLRRAFDRVVTLRGGGARFRSLPDARFHRRRGLAFAAARDDDRRAFNERFGTSILTEASVREELRTRQARVKGGYRHYAPIDFGGGLTLGQIASTDSGTGRWAFFNGAIVGPLVRGRRVLDLGCNNGSLPLMMLRAGAAAVTALELSPEIADLARLNARILAWRDMRDYQIDVVTADMRRFLDGSLGRFDVVSAFCSLYYLPEADMGRVIAAAADMGATFITQSNDSIADLPATATQLHSLMTGHGYSDVEVYRAPGFARALLVGRPAAAPVEAG
jgi:SAM-dependent methyltransferase